MRTARLRMQAAREKTASSRAAEARTRQQRRPGIPEIPSSADRITEIKARHTDQRRDQMKQSHKTEGQP